MGANMPKKSFEIWIIKLGMLVCNGQGYVYGGGGKGWRILEDLIEKVQRRQMMKDLIHYVDYLECRHLRQLFLNRLYGAPKFPY